MNKKHFEAIAAILDQAANDTSLDRETANHIAEELATEFDKFNPYFDRARFLEAAGVGN
jgi:hypothetical protein